jgi:PAPA-1-like conserved region
MGVSAITKRSTLPPVTGHKSLQTEEMLRKAELSEHRKRQAYRQLVAEKDAIVERLLNLRGKEDEERAPQKVVDVVHKPPPKPPTPPHYRWRYTPVGCSLSISSDAPSPHWLTLPPLPPPPPTVNRQT